MANPTLPLFYFYKRYKWRAQDFTDLQQALYDFPRLGMGGALGGCVVSGLDNSTTVGLAVGYTAGVAIGASGDLMAVTEASTVTVAASVKSLIVARAVATDTNTITDPTSPFSLVPLNSIRSSQVVAISGTLGAYPAVLPGDVILFGVTAGGASVSLVDKTQCQLIGKASEIGKSGQSTLIVGNKRHANYLDVASAVAAAVAGNKIRVTESATLDSTVNVNVSDIDIECDPNVLFTKGTAATGFLLSASGVKFKQGRFTGYSLTNHVPLGITGVYCLVQSTRFANVSSDSINTIVDMVGKSANMGVIYEN